MSAPTFALCTFAPFWSRKREALVPGIRPWQARASWDALCTALTRFRDEFHGDKTRVLAWSPTLYLEDRTRTADAVLELSCLVLDYDDGTPIAAASERWGQWPHIVHTSYSHTEELAKFRVVVPFERPVPVKWWPRVWAWAERHSGRAVDVKCKDPSRVYFVPALRSPDAPRFARVVWGAGGRLLDLDLERLPKTADELAVEAAQARAQAARPAYSPSTPRSANRDRSERLKTDPDARMALGLEVGGRVVGQRVTGIACPGCGRPDVWFLVAPDAFRGAECNHKRSCGWHGWLDQLGARGAA